MRLFLGAVFSCLLVATMALPTLRIKRQADPFGKLAALINKVKSEETYTKLKRQLSHYGAVLELLIDFAVEIPQDDNFEYHKAQYIRIIEAVFDLLKGIVPETAHPSESEVTELAKKLSQAIRETKFASYNFIPEGTQFLMTNGTIAKLQNIFVSKPILEQGNDFMTTMKETDEKMHRVATMLKFSFDDPENFVEYFTDKRTRQFKFTKEAHEFFYFIYQMVIDHYATLLRSEENAVEFFKDFAIVVKALKDPSSYESLEALSDALAESKSVESMIIVLRHIMKFMTTTMSEQEQDEFYQITERALSILKAVFANGPTTDKATIQRAVIKWIQENQMKFDYLTRKVGRSHDGRNIKVTLRDLFTEEERAMMEELILSSQGDIFISDAKLKELRKKSEIVYAVVYWTTDNIRTVRRFNDFGPEADAFDKKYNTVPTELKQMIVQFPPSETLNAIMLKEHSDRVREFNALSKETKKELCAAYPYFTFSYLVTLK